MKLIVKTILRGLKCLKSEYNIVNALKTMLIVPDINVTRTRIKN